MGWLKMGILVLPLFIFCVELEADRDTSPFVMPMLPQEKGKPASDIIKGDGSIKVENFDAFVRAVSEQKIRERAYWRLEWDSGQYTEGSFALD